MGEGSKHKKAKRQIILEPHQHFEIEEEIVNYATWLADLIFERNNPKVPKTNNIYDEIYYKKQGFIGQELFAGLLLQYKIPNVYAVPLYKNAELMRRIDNKDFDFFISSLPKDKQYISIKTVTEGNRNLVIIPKFYWNNEKHDVLIVIKVDSIDNKIAHIAGWLYAEEVENLPTFNFGYGEAFWTYLDRKDVKGNNKTEVAGISSPKLMILRRATDIIDELKKVALGKIG